MNADRAAVGGPGQLSPPGQRQKWWLFSGTGRPLDTVERDRQWPSPPPWRAFHGGPDLPPPPDDEPEAARRLGAVASSMLEPGQISVVNAAIFLRRPLLVTGRPGSGKSSLAYLLARELRLGRVLQWPITSRTSLKDGLYDYDAIGRAQATIQLRGTTGPKRYNRLRSDDAGDADRSVGGAFGPSVGEFIRLGPLGTALLPHRLPRVLLVDEMDKSDFDLPNDLLNIFEDGEFDIPELVRVRRAAGDVEVHTDDPGGTAVVRHGAIRCHAFPIVVITSNGEREFPPAFLRRCTLLNLPDPDAERLAALVAAHFPENSADFSDLVARFEQRRAQVGGLAADQLLNAVHLAASGAVGADLAAWDELLEAIWHRLTLSSEPG